MKLSDFVDVVSQKPTMIITIKSTDLDPGAAPDSKSVEFIVVIMVVFEIHHPQNRLVSSKCYTFSAFWNTIPKRII